MEVRIEEEFFARPIHEVAQDLLGRDLYRGERRGRIVEVEVYEGKNDGASHARKGVPTGRSWPMFGPPGTIYVYQIYGRYHCLNLRAGREEEPGAILIRACEPLEGLKEMARGRGLEIDGEECLKRSVRKLMSGPARLTQALGVDKSLNGRPVGEGLVLESGSPPGMAQIMRTPRVGLNRKTCGSCVDWQWRYLIADSIWVSR